MKVILLENVSISELSLESLELYPNPADGWVNIKYDLLPRVNAYMTIAHDSNQLTRLDEIYASRNYDSWVLSCQEALSRHEQSSNIICKQQLSI